MTLLSDPSFARPIALIRAALAAPPGRARIAASILLGFAVHLLFASAVAAMIAAMGFGMQHSLGRVPYPWAIAANAFLIAQFPLAHSLLLTRKGHALLARITRHGATIAPSTYALIASAQLLALFALWTPSGIVWWTATGPALALTLTLYAAAWLLLAKASFDAGIEVQSGALGWLSLAARIRPIYPDMPTSGLFRHIRQPIYLAFALTLWTVPVWTPDQLVLALAYTAYCLLAPRLKERRFAARYGARFAAYRARVPYMLPGRKQD